MWLSIIVPALDEADTLRARRADFDALRQPGVETVLVDGGSRDATRSVARPAFDRVVGSDRGRARQMNHGAAIAKGEWLLFVHADTRLGDACLAALQQRIERDPSVQWGRFDVRLSGRNPLLRLVAFMMNQRAAVTGIATGDQCLFMRASLLAAVGGYPDLPLMEDITVAGRLRRHGWPARIREPVVTDSRRWERHGIVRTIVLMWTLRLAYWVGVPAQRLAHWYAER